MELVGYEYLKNVIVISLAFFSKKNKALNGIQV
jgi:hypothetical protein